MLDYWQDVHFGLYTNEFAIDGNGRWGVLSLVKWGEAAGNVPDICFQFFTGA